MPPEFDRAAAARMSASPIGVWKRVARQSLPKAEPETIERAARAFHDAAQALRTLGDGRWQARGYAWQRYAEAAEAPDDDAAVVIGATLGAILQVVPSEAAQLERHGKTLSAELPDAIERVRRQDRREPARPHKPALAHGTIRQHAPRANARERREHRSTRPTRAGPHDGDGLDPPGPGRRPRRSSDQNRRLFRRPR